MKKKLPSSKVFKGIISFLFFLLFSFIGYSQTINFSGTISSDTNWSADTIKVIGDITINDSVTLTINPGTYIEFQSYYSIIVYGRMLAIGTSNDSITFTINDTTGFANYANILGGWDGVYLDGAPVNDSSLFEYCKFSYSKYVALNPGNGHTVRIQNCLFNNNFGAIWSYNNINSIIKNNYFINNREALYAVYSSSLTIFNNVFQNNWIGISDYCSSIIIANNIISHSKDFGILINDTSSASVIITQNEITYNRTGIFINGAYNSQIQIIENVINYNNNVGQPGSGIYVNKASPSIVNNTIAYNSASGGSGIFIGNSSPLISFNKICNNQATGFGCGVTDDGAGILAYNSSPFIINNLICNNEAENRGGGISIMDTSSVTMINNTIVNNRSNQQYGGGISIALSAGDAVLKNNIIFGNEVNQDLGLESSQIFTYTTSTPFEIDYCDISDTINFYGYFAAYYQNLILLDPLFVNPTIGAGVGYDGLSSDWSLQLASPCNNTGTPDTTGLHLYSTDIIGNSRVKFGRIDRGAYESLNYLPLVTASATSDSICAGSSITLTGGGASTYLWTDGVSNGLSFVPTSTTTYTLTGTDENEFSNTATITITVLPTKYSNQTLTLCNGQSISIGSITHDTTGTFTDVLSASNGCDSTVTTYLTVLSAATTPLIIVAGNVLTSYDSTGTYQWIDCDNDGIPIEGAIYQTYIAIESGSYAVILSNGVCKDTSICTIVLTSGITYLFIAQSVSISPNPVKDNLLIQSDEKIKSIRCVNYLGQSVGLILESNSINTSALSEGMYFLNIITQSGKTVSKRFIKE